MRTSTQQEILRKCWHIRPSIIRLTFALTGAAERPPAERRHAFRRPVEGVVRCLLVQCGPLERSCALNSSIVIDVVPPTRPVIRNQSDSSQKRQKPTSSSDAFLIRSLLLRPLVGTNVYVLNQPYPLSGCASRADALNCFGVKGARFRSGSRTSKITLRGLRFIER